MTQFELSAESLGLTQDDLNERTWRAVLAEFIATMLFVFIGAETPEEIAVAVMAEIIQARRGGTGLPMREASRRRRGIAPVDREEPRRS